MAALFILATFLSHLSTKAVFAQNVRGIEVGFPEKWDGDKFKEASCPARGIPSFLDGYFLCQVSATYGRDYDPPGQRLSNMIDALGGIASFHINQGRDVTLTGSYYPSRRFKIYDFYNRDLRKSKVAWPAGFSAWNKTQADLWDKIPRDPDTASFHSNVDFWKLGRDIIGGTEAPDWVGVKFHVPTLENFKKFPFVETSDIFRGTSPIKTMQMPIHERLEKDGSIWASTSAFHPVEMRMYQIVFSVSPSGVRTIEGMFEFGRFDPSRCSPNGDYNGDKRALPGYMHSITSTENYVILPVTSGLINPCRFLQPPTNKTTGDVVLPEPEEFDRDVPLRFLVFNKRTKRFETEPPLEAYPAMWISHQFNAYEKPDGTLVADMIAYDRGDIYSRELNLDVRKREVWPASSRLLRFTIDIRQQRVKYDYLIPQEQISAEFSQFNHEFEGEQYKYGYVVISPYAAGSQIMKLDVDEPSGRNNKFFNPGPTVAVGEPWYVPNPGSSEEDDGVVLVRAVDTGTRKSILYVIDAKTMVEIGRADVPTAVPFGFHNRYYSKRELGLPPGYKPPGDGTLNPNPNLVIQPFLPPQPPPINPPFQPQNPNPNPAIHPFLPPQPRPINPGPLQPQPINPGPFQPFPRNTVNPNPVPPIPQPPPLPTDVGGPNTVVVYPPSPRTRNTNQGTRKENNNEQNPFVSRPPNRNNNGFDVQRIAEAGRKLICSWLKNIDQIKGYCG